MELAPLSASFQSLPLPPTIKLGPSGAASQVGGFVCEAGSFSHCSPNLHRCFQSEVWGFIYPCCSPGLRGLLCSPVVPPSLSMRECGASGSASHLLVGSVSCSLACPVPQSATSLGPPVATLPRVLPAWLPVSAPPIGLDECFFFISWVVGLPYSSIFCQFQWFFVFKLLLSFFWLCEEAECVYLHFLLGRKLSSFRFFLNTQ